MAEEQDLTRSRLFGSGIVVLCGAAILMAILDLAGWCFHIPALIGVFPNSVTMKPNTAASVGLVALGTLGRLQDRRFALSARLVCWIALALGLATLVEYWRGRDLGIDQWILRVPSDGSGAAGRMSMGTALDVVFSSAALLTLSASPVAGRILSAGAGLISLSALIGIVFGAGPLYGVKLLRSMAAQTGACFLALQVAYFLLIPDGEPVRSLWMTARRHRSGVWFVVGTCALPLLLGWPIAIAYRHGNFDASFGFAMLVVLLMVSQTLLVASNSRSLARVEDRRERTERDRQILAVENARQYAELGSSEARAAKSEARYRLISDALPALVSYVGQDLRYIQVNRTYEEWFGVSASEVEGRSLQDVLGESAENIRAQMVAALAGEAQEFETQMQTLQGSRTVTVSYRPDIDGEGKIRGVVALVNDVTASRQAEVCLRQTEKLVAVGRLASSIAHEIRNPLEAVTNLLYLAKTTPDPGEIREFLSTAEAELLRVSRIAGETLKFHRETTTPVAVNMGEMFGSVLTMYRPRLLGGLIRVEQRFRGTEPITCLDGEIRQVLNNLVGNAMEAMQNQPGRLLLRSCDAHDFRTGRAGMSITVADTGGGMSSKTLGSLFEAFFTTKGAHGTGLGLWVSKEIVDRHEGRLRVRSSQQPGKSGTVFLLFLPC